MEVVCKICKNKYEKIIESNNICPNCGFVSISAKERNDYLKELNNNLDENDKIELIKDSNKDAMSINNAFKKMYSNNANMTLSDIYLFTSICYKEVENKNEYIYHVLADIYLLCSSYMPADKYYLYWLKKSADCGNKEDLVTYNYLTFDIENIE